MMAQRMYGPEGFTRTAEVCALLDPLETSWLSDAFEDELAKALESQPGVSLEPDQALTSECDLDPAHGRSGDDEQVLTPEQEAIIQRELEYWRRQWCKGDEPLDPEMEDMIRFDLEVLHYGFRDPRPGEMHADDEDYDEDDEDDDIVSFEWLTLDAARRLLALLPPGQVFDRQNRAPSFAEMLALGERFPGTCFHGYRVPPCREDERVTLEGFFVPAEHAARTLAALRGLPDEWTEFDFEGRLYFRAWWD